MSNLILKQTFSFFIWSDDYLIRLFLLSIYSVSEFLDKANLSALYKKE